MLDCIIIGTGAAGISAALTLSALKRSFKIIGSKKLSAKIRAAEKIKNYPGLIEVSGEEMSQKFLCQLESAGIEICEDKVNGVYPVEDGYTVMCGGGQHDAKTVILCTGVETVKPVKGELEFLGRGVSYCAVCDGFLYKDKVIAVFMESADDAHEVELLAKYAKTVHLFSRKIGFCPQADNVICEEGRITEIAGDMRVRNVVCGERILPVDGVFMLKESVSAGSLVHGLKTENGVVTVERNGVTNLAGVFAAGDITGRPYQYAKAVGEGNVCAYSVNEYLNKMR